ncbi:MAG: glycosyltransferase family 4 protein [Treponema sp.]|nr:glycosyltransferase family 4 protein [Treponema sp.]
MKIVFDCRWHKKSGIGTFADNTLKNMLKTENEFLLLGFNSLPEEFSASLSEEDLKRIKCINCDISAFSFKELLFFPKTVSKVINQYDVYFSPYCNIPSGIKIPVFTTIHDVLFLDMPEIAGKAGTFIRKIFYKYAIFRSKAIFTVSEYSKQRIIYTLKCKKHIFVTYNGVPENYLKQDKISTPKTDSIIFIGNIKKHKGIQILIPAFKEFCKELSSKNLKTPKLIIVGSKDNFRTNDASISSLIQSADENDIEFTGFISDEELKKRLSQAKILIQPSFYEGFGLPPLQALNCGTNTIVSDIEVFKEVYKNYPVTYFKTGDISDLKEKMLDVWLENKPVPDFTEQYSFKNTCDSILNALEIYCA